MSRHFLAGLALALALATAPAAEAVGRAQDTIVLPVVVGAVGGSELSSAQPFGGPGRVIRNVTQPSLTVFSPAPGSATGAAMIIAPGGGFQFLSIDTEGEDLARWLAARGVTAFVLRYRTAPMPVDPAGFKQEIIKRFRPGALTPQTLDAMGAPGGEDGRMAVRTVRTEANRFGVDPKRIGVIGFSAGGWVALSTAAAPEAEARPDLVAAIYPARPTDLRISAQAPPLFVAAAADDPLLKVDGQIELYQLWRAARRPAELHLYPKGGHGFGMTRQRVASDHWIDAFGDWLAGQGWLAPRP